MELLEKLVGQFSSALEGPVSNWAKHQLVRPRLLAERIDEIILSVRDIEAHVNKGRQHAIAIYVTGGTSRAQCEEATEIFEAMASEFQSFQVLNRILDAKNAPCPSCDVEIRSALERRPDGQFGLRTKATVRGLEGEGANVEQKQLDDLESGSFGSPCAEGDRTPMFAAVRKTFADLTRALAFEYRRNDGFRGFVSVTKPLDKLELSVRTKRPIAVQELDLPLRVNLDRQVVLQDAERSRLGNRLEDLWYGTAVNEGLSIHFSPTPKVEPPCLTKRNGTGNESFNLVSLVGSGVENGRRTMDWIFEGAAGDGCFVASTSAPITLAPSEALDALYDRFEDYVRTSKAYAWPPAGPRPRPKSASPLLALASAGLPGIADNPSNGWAWTFTTVDSLLLGGSVALAYFAIAERNRFEETGDAGAIDTANSLFTLSAVGLGVLATVRLASVVIYYLIAD